MESIFVFVIMDGSGPGDNPLSVSFVRSLTVQQLWCLLWTVLAVLREFSTDPWEGSGVPTQSTAAHSTAAPSTAAPATPAGVPPPTLGSICLQLPLCVLLSVVFTWKTRTPSPPVSISP